MPDIGTILASSFERAPWGWATFATILLALIKTWPIIQAQVIEAKAKLRGEKRDDLHECREELKAVNGRLDDLQDAHHREMSDIHDVLNNLKIEMSAVLSAYRVLEAETEARDPTSLALKHARSILRTAFAVAPSTIPGSVEQRP